jgi:hypothetical protein
MLNRVGDSPYSSSSLHHPTCGTLWWQRHAQQNYWKTFPDNSMTNRTSVDLKTTCHAAVTMHVAAIALTRSVVASIRLCCAQPCQCVLSQPVANSHSRSVALNRPTFEQRWQWGRFRATPSIVFFFAVFMWGRALATVWCTFCWPHLPKVLLTGHFWTSFTWNRALATVWCTFCRAHLLKVLRAPHSPLDFELQSELSPQYATVLCTSTFADQRANPKKTQGFAPESVVTRDITRSRTVTLLTWTIMISCWHEHNDSMMMTCWKECPWTVVRNSEVV